MERARLWLGDEAVRNVSLGLSAGVVPTARWTDWLASPRPIFGWKRRWLQFTRLGKRTCPESIELGTRQEHRPWVFNYHSGGIARRSRFEWTWPTHDASRFTFQNAAEPGSDDLWGTI